MGVEKFLDASTGYITYADSRKLLEAPEDFPSLVISHEYGWWIHVGGKRDLPEMFQRMRADGFSEAFIMLIKKASNWGCWWINLDCDGFEVEGLEVIEW